MNDEWPRHLLDALPDAVVVVDERGTIREVNARVTEWFGWASEELVGSPLDQLLVTDAPLLPAVDSRYGGQAREVLARTRVDQRVPVEICSRRHGASDGPPTGQDADSSTGSLVLTMRVPRDRTHPADPTGAATASAGAGQFPESRARAEIGAEDLDAERHKLQAILDALPIGVVLLEGSEGHLTLVNPAARTMSGSAKVLEGDVLAGFGESLPVYRLDGRLYELSERPLWRALHRGEYVREVLKHHQEEDGRAVWVEVSTAPFPGLRGGVVASFRDVTEEVQLRSELAERAAQFKALLDHLPVGVAYFDDHGICRAANGPTRRILRRSRESTIGATSADLFAAAPSLHEALSRCLHERQPHAESSSPWPDPGSEDGCRYLDWRFEPLPLTHGLALGALALIVDVTDRKLAADRLRVAAEAAQQASRYKSQFLSAVSHDLRTPVNALSLLADWINLVVDRQAIPDPELRSLIADLKRSTSGLVDLVNDLLELTLFDSGDLSFHPTVFALSSWLDENLAPLRITARAKGLEFSWFVDLPERVAHGDRVKMGRVLLNLVGNAIKFTDRGSVVVRSGLTPEGDLAISVTDTGSGIPQDQLGRIFDEFAQLRNPQRDRTKGTGLGLAICRRLVEGTGGRIVVESEIGTGTTFTALYPPDHVPLSPTMDVGTGSAETHVLKPSPSGAGCILLVEDDPYSRRSLARLLERQGYRVEEAESGTAAMAAVRRELPALVLLDLMLPGMDGSEVLREIRTLADRHVLPVVVLSGDLLSDRTEKLQALDVNAILAKPIEFSELIGILHRCLEVENVHS